MARPSRRLGNLPAEATTFVGRRRELAEVKRKLSAARLVSLVGPGGVGKSRLALRAAADLGRAFPNGAWWVELAEVRDPALVGDAILAALDLRDHAATEPSALLLAYLRDKQALLVIDNCDHLLDAAASVISKIIGEAPGVRVMVTSRETLSVTGEHVIPVPPLELPPAHSEEPLNQLRQNEAVMLFVERAEAASGRFDVTQANRSAVADICRRLDGLPLALELAAVRTRVLSVEQILERLSDRFALLTGGGRAALPRHQTLETAIDWSSDLLTEAERVLFRRLCAFAGRFTMQDVESVCTDAHVPGAGALDLMSSLVDKSLVIKEDVRGVACYRLHETMREYAAQKVRSAGEHEPLAERCIDYYVSTCDGLALQARFKLVDWLSWMDLEIDNIRAVLKHCLTRSDLGRGLLLATCLGWYWITRATSEGIRWLDAYLASGADGRPDTLAWAYFIRGFLGVLQGDWVASRPALEQAIAISRDAGLPIQLTHSLSIASTAENLAGNHAGALRRLEEAAGVAANLEDVPSRVSVLQARSLNAIFEGDFDAIKAAATEGVRLSREIGDLYSLHMMLLNLGGAALFAGDLEESKRCYLEGMEIAYEVDDRIGQTYLLAVLANHAALAGKPRVAAQLLGASENMRLGTGATLFAALTPIVIQAQDLATAALGESRFQSEFDSGRRMKRKAAVQLALGKPSGPQSSEHHNGEMLGQREGDVARLVADGLSNKQIAARLFISERTVDSHVRHILNKLGFNSRAQIAAWVGSVKN